jgi:oligosaccharide repeat unit polymerase
MIWLVLLIVAFHQAWVVKHRGYFDPLSIETLLDVVVLVVCAWGPLVDERSLFLSEHDPLFAIAVIGGIVALYVGFHAQVGAAAPAERRWTPVPSRILWLCVAAFSATTALLVMDSARRAGGLATWLFGARNLVYGEGLDAGAPALVYQLMMAARAGVLVFLAIALRRRQWVLAAFLYGLLLLGILSIFVTRLELVITLLLPVAYYHYRVRRVPWPVFGVLAVIFLVLISVLNVFRGGGLEVATAFFSGLSLSTLQDLSGFGQDINVLYPFSVLWDMHSRNALPLEHGMNYVYMLLTYVPRVLWPGKPNTAFEPRFTVLVQGGLTGDLGNASVWTFTAWGEGFAQFALIGVFINLFLYGYVVRRVRRTAQQHPDLILVWLYMTVMLATFLRAGFQALFILATTMMVPAWLLVSRPWKPRHRLAAAAPARTSEQE